MLKNDYLLAKIGFDTAENEPSKVWTCLPATLPPLNQLRMVFTKTNDKLLQLQSLLRMKRLTGAHARRRMATKRLHVVLPRFKRWGVGAICDLDLNDINP